jgi:hypothetical protein
VKLIRRLAVAELKYCGGEGGLNLASNPTECTDFALDGIGKRGVVDGGSNNLIGRAQS